MESTGSNGCCDLGQPAMVTARHPYELTVMVPARGGGGTQGRQQCSGLVSLEWHECNVELIMPDKEHRLYVVRSKNRWAESSHSPTCTVCMCRLFVVGKHRCMLLESHIGETTWRGRCISDISIIVLNGCWIYFVFCKRVLSSTPTYLPDIHTIVNRTALIRLVWPDPWDWSDNSTPVQSSGIHMYLFCCYRPRTISSWNHGFNCLESVIRQSSCNDTRNIRRRWRMKRESPAQ